MIDHTLAAKMVEIDHNISTYPLLKFEICIWRAVLSLSVSFYDDGGESASFDSARTKIKTR